MTRAHKALQQQIKSIEVSALLDTEGECKTVWGGSNVEYVPYPIRTVGPRSLQTTEVSYSPVRMLNPNGIQTPLKDSLLQHRRHQLQTMSLPFQPTSPLLRNRYQQCSVPCGYLRDTEKPSALKNM